MNVRATPILMAAALVIGSHVPAAAQTTWENGQPVFRSDREAAARRAAARREKYRFRYPAIMSGGGRPNIKPEAPKIVSFPNTFGHGSIVIDTRARKLYYTVSTNSAFQYPISVGREGFKWYGTEKVSRKQSWPSWTPPPEMRKRQPYLPITMKGGVKNPLGAKAIYLGKTLYRIHGTNDPKTIGRAASSGCFRMMNKHVLHLSGLVDVGTPVHVVRKWRGPETSGAPKNASERRS